MTHFSERIPVVKRRISELPFFLCLYHSSIAPCSFIHPPQTLCNLSNCQRRWISHSTTRSNVGYRLLTARRVPLVKFSRGTLPVQVVPETKAQLVSCEDEMCVIQLCTAGSTGFQRKVLRHACRQAGSRSRCDSSPAVRLLAADCLVYQAISSSLKILIGSKM